MWKYQSNHSLNKYAQSFINLNKNDKLRYLQILNYQNHYLFNFYLNLYRLSERNNYNTETNNIQQPHQGSINRNTPRKEQTNIYSMQERIQMLRNKLYKNQNHDNKPQQLSDPINKSNDYNNEVLERYRTKRKEQEKKIIEERQKIVEIQKEKSYKNIEFQSKIEKKTEVKLPEQIKKNEIRERNQLVQYQDIKMLDNLVTNKRVIVVGPAAYLNNLNNGEFIDSFDIVIRINRGSLIKRNMVHKIGRRTDVLFSNLNILDNESSKFLDTNFLKNSGVKMIYCAYPKIRPFTEDQQKYFSLYGNTFPIETIDTNFYMNIHAALNTRPNTGILAILVLLRMNLKNLYVTGFSFYNDGYYNGYNDQKDNRTLKKEITRFHNQTSQREIVKKIFLNNDRIFLDKTIISILFPSFIKIYNTLNEVPFDNAYKYILDRETCKINKIVTNKKAKILILNDKTKRMTNEDKKYDIVFHNQLEMINKIRNGIFINELYNLDKDISKEYTIFLNPNSGNIPEKKNYILFNTTIIKWIGNNIFRMNSNISIFGLFSFFVCLNKTLKAKVYYIESKDSEDIEYLNFLGKMGLCLKTD
jgi:hypothetical protein